MVKDKYSTIKQIDEKTFAITEYEITQKNVGFNINFIPLIIVLIIAFILVCVFISNTPHTDDNSNVPQTQILVDTTGFVFSNSDNVYLSNEDMAALEVISSNSHYTYQELLRFAVNEIYARHGHLFNPQGKYSSFYNQFDWYKKLPKKEVVWSDFNQVETSNLNLLIETEKNNGFR